MQSVGTGTFFHLLEKADLKDKIIRQGDGSVSTEFAVQTPGPELKSSIATWKRNCPVPESDTPGCGGVDLRNSPATQPG